MKREPDYKLKKRLERMEHEKKMNRTYNRNWIICIGSLAIIILAIFVFGGKWGRKTAVRPSSASMQALRLKRFSKF